MHSQVTKSPNSEFTVILKNESRSLKNKKGKNFLKSLFKFIRSVMTYNIFYKFATLCANRAIQIKIDQFSRSFLMRMIYNLWNAFCQRLLILWWIFIFVLCSYVYVLHTKKKNKIYFSFPYCVIHIHWSNRRLLPYDSHATFAICPAHNIHLPINQFVKHIPTQDSRLFGKLLLWLL